MMIISDKEAAVLVSTENTGEVREIVENNKILNDFYDAFVEKVCKENGCAPHKRMNCFREFLQSVTNKNGKNLIRLLNAFVAATGTIADRFESINDVVEELHPNMNKKQNDIIPQLLKMLIESKLKSREPKTPEEMEEVMKEIQKALGNDAATVFVSIQVSEQTKEIIVTGDREIQPTLNHLREIFLGQFPTVSFSDYKVVRKDSSGRILNSKTTQPGLVSDIKKIEEIDQKVTVTGATSLSDLIARIKEMS